MNRAVTTALVTVLTIATAPAAYSAPRTQDCGHGNRQDACATSRSDHYERNDKRGAQKRETHATRDRDQGRSRVQARAQTREHIRNRGHAPTAAQLRRLPKLPRGQEYRIIDNRVTRIDSETAQVVAVLGLLSSLLN